MELLERTHATDLASAVRGAAGSAASQASQVAHKAGDRASDLIDPLVEPLRRVRHRRSTWGRMAHAARQHPWAIAATLVVLAAIAYGALRGAARPGLDIDDVAADADAANRIRSAA